MAVEQILAISPPLSSPTALFCIFDLFALIPYTPPYDYFLFFDKIGKIGYRSGAVGQWGSFGG